MKFIESRLEEGSNDESAGGRGWVEKGCGPREADLLELEPHRLREEHRPDERALGGVEP